MTRSSRLKQVSNSVDDALLAPWIAIDRVSSQDARLFSAAMASDPSLANDVAAAKAERDAVLAMAEALGRPSARPMLALFAAIDAEQPNPPANVTRLTFERSHQTAPQGGAVPVRFGREKISGWR